MEHGLLERPGLLRAGLALRRRGVSRLLHISRILAIKEALELGDDQVQELRDIRVELARKLIKITSDIRTARFDSFNALTTKPVNFEQLRTNSKNVSQLRLQRKTAVIDAFEKASKTLSDRQKEKLHEYVAAWVDECGTEADESEE